jgi:hypothetical protein
MLINLPELVSVILFTDSLVTLSNKKLTSTRLILNETINPECICLYLGNKHEPNENRHKPVAIFNLNVLFVSLDIPDQVTHHECVIQAATLSN